MPLARCLTESLYGVSLSVNSLRWCIRSERAGNAWFLPSDHVTQNASAAQNNEAKGLGKSGTVILTLLFKIMLCAPNLQMRQLSPSIQLGICRWRWFSTLSYTWKPEKVTEPCQVEPPSKGRYGKYPTPPPPGSCLNTFCRDASVVMFRTMKFDTDRLGQRFKVVHIRFQGFIFKRRF